MDKTETDFRSVAELCREFGVGYWALNRHIRLGELPSFKLGNVRYIKLSDFEAWFSTYKKWGRTKQKAEVLPKETVINSGCGCPIHGE